ncbi:hypothetical protein Bca52824_067923 [Brassica carinata]|uniref:Uncharacterized protein n=1 Tax=Brassica carinata TaxID=52824 RepID=A0A8X7QNB7_BRACI|nr:hypothetical protein Bca52824_067923 [Brassica carinata]
MSSLRSTSGSRRGRQSSGEARTTTDGEQLREGQDKNCEVMLELVIAELKADDYRSRMPDLMGEKISWDPEITSKIGYLRKLWIIHGQLEYGGTKGRLVHVLQKKPLPFKDLLDQIFGEHDVDQDERYSPHMLGLQLQQVQSTLDVDGTTIDQQQETQTAEPIVDLTSDQGCNRSIRSMPSRRLSRRKTSFEAQVESGFQRVVDTRQEFLEELRSRKIQKITYGDATSLQKTNKLLKNDADVREAFVKLENEEIKIKYMESILGTDRHGIPCNQVDFTATGANIGNGFMSFLGVHSTGLEEPRESQQVLSI